MDDRNIFIEVFFFFPVRPLLETAPLWVLCNCVVGVSP